MKPDINALKLSPSTIEKLKFYVYALINPNNNKIFYIGYGSGNRINQHLLGALDKPSKDDTEKIKMIKDIQKANKEVKLIIIRHGLESKADAIKLESDLIGTLSLDPTNILTNMVSGHDPCISYLSDLKASYDAEELKKIEDKVLLVSLNKTYKIGMPDEELYEITRKSWTCSDKTAENAEYLMGVYKGVIRSVYKITKKTKHYERYDFKGKLAPKNIQENIC